MNRRRYVLPHGVRTRLGQAVEAMEISRQKSDEFITAEKEAAHDPSASLPEIASSVVAAAAHRAIAEPVALIAGFEAFWSKR